MKSPRTNLLRNLIKCINKARTSGVSSSNPSTCSQSSIENFDSARRKFLTDSTKTIAAIGISTLIPLSGCKSAKEEKVNLGSSKVDHVKIAIIGSGIAGLNCAYQLKKSGIDSVLFEASNRSGGRILTHYNDSLQNGVHPEFGGDFIDSNHEDMLNLCREFNLDLLDLKEEQKKKKLTENVYFFDNRKISEAEIIKEFKKISTKIESDISSLGENYDTDAAVKLDNLPLEDYFNSLACSAWLKDILKAAYIAEFGLDCGEQSTLNFLDMINPDVSDGFQIFGESDERYRIQGGNSKLIEAIKGKISSEHIKLGHELIAISDGEDGKYLMKFKNDISYTADKVVIAIPFTILKNIDLSLKEMSEEKKNCINTLGYGMNTKLALSYANRPWRNSQNKAMGYLFHKDMVNGWDGSYNKDKDSNNNSIYMCYFGGINSKNLDGLSTKHPMAPATHLWKTQIPEENVETYVNELEKVFKGSKSEYQGKHVYVNWLDYPYTKGSYSCYKVGQWSTIAGLEAEPVGNIYFAGEHCSENFQGYMNGAAESGRHVAEKLVLILK